MQSSCRLNQLTSYESQRLNSISKKMKSLIFLRIKTKDHKPKVELVELTNVPLQYLTIKLVFPTAESPANTTLNMRSGVFMFAN
jgi:hypothetical protein